MENFALGGLAAGLGAATSTKGLIIGGAVELGVLVSGGILKSLNPGAPGQASPKNIVDAAAAVAQINQYVYPSEYANPKEENYVKYPFYAELWNAAGSACPANLPIRGLTSFGVDNTDYP